MLPIFLAAFEKGAPGFKWIGVRSELRSRKRGLPPFAKKREGWGTHARVPAHLLGDQFQDVAAAVIDYVHFSGVVLAER